ncbi:YitT family protein [Paenibacillus turpanensis]|uniref:YitT family protein n=1 Tax=Paenibacillus turpanensis TaxID=2689078 RepID=UPI001FB79C6A|nr:YitT family protein [Paenibacillus turpanensis]
MLGKVLSIVSGSFMIAIGINFFLLPYHILDGGLIGIALISHYVFGGKVGLNLILLSVPVFVLAWRFAREQFYSSATGMMAFGFMIDVLRPYRYQFQQWTDLTPVWSAVGGGLLIGLGIGVMLRFGASTGGTDLLASMLADRFPVNVGVLVFVIDVLVIAAGGVLISAETFILSSITVAVGGLATVASTMQVSLR